MRIIKLIVILSFLLQACESRKFTNIDIVGIWKNTDGSELIFNEDETFTAKSFPAEHVLLPTQDYLNVRFDGSGKWELKKDKSFWIVNLDFKRVSNSKCFSSFAMIIGGEKGILDNQPPWYLFVHKGEEGGERYKYFKSK